MAIFGHLELRNDSTNEDEILHKLITSANLAHTQNLVGGPKGVSSGRKGEVDNFCAFLFLVPRALLQLTLEGVAQRPMHQNTCFGGGYIPFRSIGL